MSRGLFVDNYNRRITYSQSQKKYHCRGIVDEETSHAVLPERFERLEEF